MGPNLRMVVFGIPRGTTKAEIEPLIQPFGESRLAIVDVPGKDDESVAVVQLGSEPASASRLSRRIDRQQMGGHTLTTWVTVLPWV